METLTHDERDPPLQASCARDGTHVMAAILFAHVADEQIPVCDVISDVIMACDLDLCNGDIWVRRPGHGSDGQKAVISLATPRHLVAKVMCCYVECVDHVICVVEVKDHVMLCSVKSILLESRASLKTCFSYHQVTPNESEYMYYLITHL